MDHLYILDFEAWADHDNEAWTQYGLDLWIVPYL
jgi:hypothetical protein